MSFIEKIKAQLHNNHANDPNASISVQRDELLSVDVNTPTERKAHFGHEVVGAAAAFEAIKAFEDHQANKGKKPSHAEAKQIIGGLAAGLAVKLIEEKGLPFASHHDKEKFAASAQKTATKDAKRALRESGVYESHELEVVDEDEKEAHKVL